MRVYDLIEKKKHGKALEQQEINELIQAYTAGKIPDYQMSAFLMAVYFRGMTDKETFDLTGAMECSGDRISPDTFGPRSVDKHSTGGVGDKTTLIVAPIVAAAGGIVAKMSGRGLGHTGGTVDKLESFPGFRTSLSPDDFANQVQKHGIAVIGQSADLAPADKKLYALRDVTATVDSIPLIASSIMCKKLAAGTRSIVLDVKCGAGAFMQTPEAARELAQLMVRIGQAHHRHTAAIISNMDIPLGHAVGNIREVKEAIEVLRGKGPQDLREVCLQLATLMIALSLQKEQDEAATLARDILDSGHAYEKFCQWIAAQGGDVSFARDPEKFPKAAHSAALCAPCDGYMLSCNAGAIGNAATLLGAGRATKDAAIDHTAGIVLLKKPGDAVVKGEAVAQLYASQEELLSPAAIRIEEALTYTAVRPLTQKLIYDILI